MTLASIVLLATVLARDPSDRSLPGTVTVQPEEQPGEQILAQASHTCAAPGVWDWAAYIYTY